MRIIFVIIGFCFCAVNASHAATGVASIYFYGPTASGVRFDPRALTAAMISLDGKRVPFGSKVKVCRPNGNCIVVTVTDRGPYVRGRIIDLTPAAAKGLGFTARGKGVARVTVEPLGWVPRHDDFGGF